MPCLDEAETLEFASAKPIVLETTRFKGEVLIGDNGSTDGSQEIARRAARAWFDVPVRVTEAGAFSCNAGGAQQSTVVMGRIPTNSYDFTKS